CAMNLSSPACSPLALPSTLKVLLASVVDPEIVIATGDSPKVAAGLTSWSSKSSCTPEMAMSGAATTQSGRVDVVPSGVAGGGAAGAVAADADASGAADSDGFSAAAGVAANSLRL